MSISMKPYKWRARWPAHRVEPIKKFILISSLNFFFCVEFPSRDNIAQVEIFRIQWNAFIYFKVQENFVVYILNIAKN